MVFTLLVGMFSFPAYAEGNTTTISGDGTADKTGTMTITLVIPKKTPAATDLTYTAPSDLAYSGSDKAATVTAKDSVTGMGTITVKYYSDDSRTTEATPKNVGTYYVGATVAEGDQYAASTAVLYGDDWTFTITASTPGAPAAPTKASATKNSITLNAVSGCEYSKDGTNWQSGTEFTELTPGMEYSFYQRVKATANTNASPASSASFTTEADTYAMTITLVIKPAQTITASDVTATYGDTDKSVTASVTTPATGGGAISYTVKDGSGDYIDVASDDEKKIAEEATEKNKDLLDAMKEILGDNVSKVEVSPNALDTPARLTTVGQMSMEMERILSQGPDGTMAKAEKVLSDYKQAVDVLLLILEMPAPYSDILYMRYVKQMTCFEVAGFLYIARTTFFRQQETAIRLLDEKLEGGEERKEFVIQK